MRLGAGVAVSGLAVGAIAFAVPAAVSGTAAPAPAPAEMLDRPILGGTATPVDARMQLAPAQAPSSTPPTPSSAVPVPGADGEALDR